MSDGKKQLIESLRKRNLKLLDPKSYPHILKVQCKKCGQEWFPDLASGGGFKRGALVCPNGCNRK